MKALIVGGTLNKGSSVELYPHSKRVIPGPQIPRFGHAAALISNRVLIAGGIRDGLEGIAFLDSTELLDLQTHTWSPGPTLPALRAKASAAVYKEKVFLFGSHTKDPTCLVSDFDANKWEEIAPMQHATLASAALCLGDKMFVIAGAHDDDNRTSIDTVDVYSPLTNSWSAGPKLLEKTTVPAVAELEGCIMVAGGLNLGEVKVLDSVQKMDPREGQWRYVAAMNQKRWGHQLVNLDGYLMAMGGNGGETELDSVEKYDARCDKWEIIQPLQAPRNVFTATVIA